MNRPTMTASMWYKLVLIVADAHKESADESQLKQLTDLMVDCQKHLGVYKYSPDSVVEEPVKIAHTIPGGCFESYKQGRSAPPPPPPGPPPGWKKPEIPAVVGAQQQAPTFPCSICGVPLRSLKDLEEHNQKSSSHRLKVMELAKQYEREEGPRGI